MEFPKFTKLIDTTLVYNEDGEFIFYVPEIYFEREIATQEGSIISLLGLLDYARFDASGKVIGGLKRFNLATVFSTCPYKVDKQKNVKLIKTSDPQDYRLLRYKKGDAIFTNISMTKDVSHTEQFFALYRSGKFPNTIPYGKIHETLIDSLEYNGASFGLNWQLFGICVSETCRDPNDVKKPFRYSAFTDQTAYKGLNISDIPKYVSPYSSITSENWDNAIMGAINSDSKMKSPMEKMLTVDDLNA